MDFITFPTWMKKLQSRCDSGYGQMLVGKALKVKEFVIVSWISESQIPALEGMG